MGILRDNMKVANDGSAILHHHNYGNANINNNNDQYNVINIRQIVLFSILMSVIINFYFGLLYLVTSFMIISLLRNYVTLREYLMFLLTMGCIIYAHFVVI